MVVPLFNNLTDNDIETAIENLIVNSSPRQDFFLMMNLSILMATFGLLLNNVAIIIGSMLIAPLLYPLMSLSLGVVINDMKLIWNSFYTIVKASVLGVIFAALVTAIFSPDFKPTPEILLRTNFSLEYLLIAIIAGAAASFSLVKPLLNERLPGVAISVALIPPLAVNGIGMATLNWEIIRQSILLFLINIIGILFASLVIFSLMGLQRHKKITKKAYKKEERVIEKEREALEGDS